MTSVRYHHVILLVEDAKGRLSVQNTAETRFDCYSGFSFLRVRKPPAMPMAFWRMAQPYRWGIGALGVVVATIAVFSVYFVVVLVWDGWSVGLARIGSSGVAPSWFPPIVAVTVAVIQLLRRNLKKKWWRFVYERDRDICTNCGYDLRKLPTKHVCPECGQPYNIQEVHDQWDAWFGMNEQ